jgi:hypothetical protein
MLRGGGGLLKTRTSTREGESTVLRLWVVLPKTSVRSGLLVFLVLHIGDFSEDQNIRW